MKPDMSLEYIYYICHINILVLMISTCMNIYMIQNKNRLAMVKHKCFVLLIINLVISSVAQY